MKAELECRFAQRKDILKRACNKVGSTDSSRRMILTHPKKHKTSAMCVIQKAGSTYWNYVVAVYRRHTQTMIGEDSHSKIVIGIKQTKLNTPHTLLTFVRNPYTRLLSGYVDKIFSINPMYWKKVGSKAAETVRGKEISSAGNASCGSDVTFAEFVDFILYSNDNKMDIDRHFNPIHRHCGFCNVDYDYIGKMETFVDDMVFVSDVMGLLKYDKSREAVIHWGLEGVHHMIYSNAFNVFTSRRLQMERCGVTLIEGLRVTWKRWQIRGMISMDLPFPLKADENHVTFERFNELAQKAHNESDPKVLSEGKKRALREAYGSLTYEAKVRLRKLFEPEFQMFEYDPMPDYVYGKYRKDDKFSFFDNKFLRDR
ncbi:carbohydrate sulfotransferase 8-like [Haliotis rufescens]|uniref:carbohydrate sulfotransferase 8-like n=1 Tax=Haliotis rufescens TaxID=6454 RepID=UPI00201FB34E|nr:carbohydrate sulfotransferase 8-like [Haliotis rufescens]